MCYLRSTFSSSVSVHLILFLFHSLSTFCCEVKRKKTLLLFLDSCTERTPLRWCRSSFWVGSSLLLAADAVVMETTQREIWQPLCCSSPTCQQHCTDSVPSSVYPFELNQKRIFLINWYLWFSTRQLYIFFLQEYQKILKLLPLTYYSRCNENNLQSPGSKRFKKRNKGYKICKSALKFQYQL